MRTMLFSQIAMSAVMATVLSVAAHAQTSSPDTPGAVTGGSDNVSIGGKNAARQGDTVSDGSVVVEGSNNVFINGKPAAITSGKTSCGGIVVGGSGGVFINGKPAGRTGDWTSGCPK
jgi:uncharacterized Zn-binding protein involved in type VI secretion